MAVIEVRKQEIVNGEVTIAFKAGGGKSDARVPYLVRCDAQPADLDSLKDATDGTRSVMAIGEAYKAGDTRLCTKKSIKRLGSGSAFDFVVECTCEDIDPGWNENPLLRKDTYRFSGTKETESVFMTEEDTPKPIVTPAGEPFQNLPTRTTGAFRISIEGYRQLSDASTIAAAIKAALKPNALNDGSITVRGLTFDAGAMKMVSAGMDVVTENGLTCLKVSWDLDLADDWDLHVDARGFWEKDPDGFPWRIAKGDPPVPVTKPWPLDSLGGAMTNADDEPYHMTFPIQPKQDFSAFSWTTTA